MNFEYSEDESYFRHLLCGPSEELECISLPV